MSNLSVSDWIAYLGNEKNIAYSTVLGFGAFVLAFVIGCIAITVTLLWQVAIPWDFVVLMVAISSFGKIVKPAQRRSRVSEGLLEKIMSGKLNGEDDIQKEWLTHQKEWLAKKPISN